RRVNVARRAVCYRANLEARTRRLLRIGHLTLRFTADAFPRFSSISYSMCCPSLSVLSPKPASCVRWKPWSGVSCRRWRRSASEQRAESLQGRIDITLPGGFLHAAEKSAMRKAGSRGRRGSARAAGRSRPGQEAGTTWTTLEPGRAEGTGPLGVNVFRGNLVA